MDKLDELPLLLLLLPLLVGGSEPASSAGAETEAADALALASALLATDLPFAFALAFTLALLFASRLAATLAADLAFGLAGEDSATALLRFADALEAARVSAAAAIASSSASESTLAGTGGMSRCLASKTSCGKASFCCNGVAACVLLR